MKYFVMLNTDFCCWYKIFLICNFINNNSAKLERFDYLILLARFGPRRWWGVIFVPILASDDVLG